MFKSLMKAFFGDKQTRDMKTIMPLVEEINVIAKEYEQLTDEQLQNKTNEFRRLLGVAPRIFRSGTGNTYIMTEMAENHLCNHPDVARVSIVSERRDFHIGALHFFVITKEGIAPSEDLALQLKGGMARLNEDHLPKTITFVDSFPKTADGKKIDYNTLHRIVEERAAKADANGELPFWSSAKMDELVEALPKQELSGVSLDDLLPEAFAAVKETCRRHVGKKWVAAGGEIEWNIVPFDVQLAGGISLHRGNISEMATGEGKTLVAIFPTYLNALMANGVHVVTVNDYLAKRDSEWMTPIFQSLGLSVGCIDKSKPSSPERRLAYRTDITYGTNNEFGFDYLRDNMVQSRSQLVQRDHYYAIVDEVDSVLIDEARTPLIIAGPVDRSNKQYEVLVPMIRELVNKQQILVSKLVKEATDLLAQDPKSWEAGTKLLMCEKGMPKHVRYMKLREDPQNQKLMRKVEAELMMNKQMRELEEELYFVLEEKNHQIDLTEKGRVALNPNDPSYFILPDLARELSALEPAEGEEYTPEERQLLDQKKLELREAYENKAEQLHSISQLLSAFVMKQRDVEYVVEDGKVVIVDENTGRKMPGRRWSDGLHGAVEAKEGLKIEKETQTMASITIQNYFRLYKKLSGMTGTAETEASEFMHTYKMDVIVIPQNQKLQRKDLDDILFKTEREKYAAILEEIERIHKLGKPILVGTTSVAASEKISRLLRTKKLEHNVLNAKNHAQEAEIVSKAGQPGAITIATNMAGRGTDIKLAPGVKDPVKDEEGNEWPGGLQIIGTERHESRRIDRQLRGRAGRQGDPGTSRFFVSLEDNLMRYFGNERMADWMSRMGFKEGEPLTHPWMTKSIETAQKRVESVNQERRKRTLQYDDVMNKQRETIYGLRRDLLMEDDLRDVMLNIFADAIDNEFTSTYGEPNRINDWDLEGFADWLVRVTFNSNASSIKTETFSDYEALMERAMQFVVDAYDEKQEYLGEAMINNLARYIALNTLDNEWQDHLLAIDSLREGIGLRGYAQKEPLVEFTHDATAMFTELMLVIHKEVMDRFFRAQIVNKEEQERRERLAAQLRASHPNADGEVEDANDPQKKGALSKRPLAPHKSVREKQEAGVGSE
ncbi:MAG: preprotein translocase subunit SecA [Candidatus Sumerlaeia bacterium]|nr:preprotein translocase subunit SecA [Candidatus Sumerlaeia bacterium]